MKPGNCENSHERYDMAGDPEELTIKAWKADGEAPQSLLRLCQQDPDPAGVPKTWSFGTSLRGPKSPPMEGSEQLKSLKALGYAE